MQREKESHRIHLLLLVAKQLQKRIEFGKTKVLKAPGEEEKVHARGIEGERVVIVRVLNRLAFRSNSRWTTRCTRNPIHL